MSNHPHMERIIKLSNLAVRIATESDMPDAPGEDETLVTREVERLIADKNGKEDETPQSVHHKRELEHLQGLRDQIKQTIPVYLSDPIHAIIIAYATPQVLVAFDRILNIWMDPIAHDDQDITSWRVIMRNLGLFNAALYDVVRAIFEPLEYRYGGNPERVPYTPHKEQLDFGGMLRRSRMISAIDACIDEMYPAAHKDRVFLYESRLQIAVDCEESKMPSDDPLGCVVWAIEHKVEYDGPPCMNIVSLTHASIFNFRDHFTVSSTKVQRVKYKFSSTPFAQFLREHDRTRDFVNGAYNSPESFTGHIPYMFYGDETTEKLRLELYRKALATPLPPGFNDDVKKALVMHRDELFRGGLQTSSAPTATEHKSDAKKRTPKKKRRLAWLSNTATYRQFQSAARVRRRRT